MQKPNIIVKNGEPKAVILDLREYGRLLEIAEAKSDLSELKKIKKSKTLFRPIEEYAGRL
ncbi:MAG: hypothetical protein UW30_C0021G0007 [Candidatus Giovannonibacteria bacterium GW2011_GWA2_44_13b]|uniref:Antitoxin n=1 Tax=Candidatus Giovannonibacteria bacterium GW2011_GWA2_44_13b TaxID=1618647 RepID=A0A0G1J956_9BACT|nr:MAG: hypothetical protein UW30_C0021G0007 [Candidatus Giovannonibacteria bacterium GW2011_GWA2_44_13b]